MKAEDKNKPAAEVTAEGEKVTGGFAEKGEIQSDLGTHSGSTPDTGAEATPDTETKKEEMNSYNELPDQAKVGGG